MPRLHAQPQQPGFEPGDAAKTGRPPGTAVVTEDGLWQAIAAKHVRQGGLHGAALLIGAGHQIQRKARMVIQHGQGMAATR